MTAKPCTTLLVAALLPLTWPTGEASAYERDTHFSATSVCQPATPLELGGLRQRPLGIFNNKPYAVYISCSMITQANNIIGPDRLGVSFYNSTASAVDVSCIAQGGSRTKGVNNYTASVSVPAGSSVQMQFPQIDRPDARTTINLSCLLPGGVEMGRIQHTDNIEYPPPPAA